MNLQEDINRIKGMMKINELNQYENIGYSESTYNLIKRLLSRMSLPHVFDYELTWSEKQGMYKVKLKYDEKDTDIYDHLDSNHSKVRNIPKILGLPPFSFSVTSHALTKDKG
jgi:hypothetical protein